MFNPMCSLIVLVHCVRSVQGLLEVDNTFTHTPYNATILGPQGLLKVDNTFTNTRYDTTILGPQGLEGFKAHSVTHIQNNWTDSKTDLDNADNLYTSQPASIHMWHKNHSNNVNSLYTSPLTTTRYTSQSDSFIKSLPPTSSNAQTESYMLNNMNANISLAIQDTTEFREQDIFSIFSDDVIDCMNSNNNKYFIVDKGTISLSYQHIIKHIDPLKRNEKGYNYCVINIRSKNGYQFHVQYQQRGFTEICNSRDMNEIFTMNIQVDEEDSFLQPITLNNIPRCRTYFSPWEPSAFFSSQNKIYVRILLRAGSAYHRSLNMDIQSVNEMSKPHLEVGYITPLQGYIQSPGFDRETEDIPVFEGWAELSVPRDHVTMISLYRYVFVSCPTIILSVQGAENSQNISLLDSCNLISVGANLHKTSKILIYLKINLGFYIMKYTLKILFSFHKIDSIPEKLPDGLWNCSVPYFYSFQNHVVCNLERECENGEDEMTCPYVSVACGERIAYGHKCYELVRPTEPLTWVDASEHCHSLGGYLASFNTIQEWQQIFEILSMSQFRMDVYVGLKYQPFTLLPETYREFWTWSDQTTAFYTDFYDINAMMTVTLDCSYMPNMAPSITLQKCDGNSIMFINVLCENGKPVIQEEPYAKDISIHLSASPMWSADISSVFCPEGHRTQKFLACDKKSACWTQIYPSPCDLTTTFTTFECDNHEEIASYTLVCDSERDCQDGSDESFCVAIACKPGYRKCNNGKCISQALFCNRRQDCADNTDEMFCADVNMTPSRRKPFPPAIVYFEKDGFELQRWDDLHPCPESHFSCPDGEYCLPVFTRCNGVYDCPGHEDEAECDKYTCPGYYRCRASKVCLHTSHVCDGVFQCPQHDDEMLCQLTCPGNCTCEGLAFTCTGQFSVPSHLELRYLDASDIDIDLSELSNLRFLVYLSLQNCGLNTIPNLEFPNLRILDLSHNGITILDATALQKMGKLQTLKLSGTPLVMSSNTLTLDAQYVPLRNLDLSFVILEQFDANDLTNFPNLEGLNLSMCGIQSITDNGFSQLNKLRSIDLRGNEISEFGAEILKTLKYLENVYTDNFKMCCTSVLPSGFKLSNCLAPRNELSSCDDLLRATEYRICLWLFASLAIFGNIGSFLYRAFFHHGIWKSSFNIFVTNLSVADFLIGVYLATIGGADLVYRGSYVWHDTHWRQSVTCQFTGFLSLVSNEVSCFIICLITVDRFLVMHFPFSRLHFQKRSALWACVVTWCLGTGLAVVPFLPGMLHWKFYSQTGICIPLPVTRATFPGRHYSFGVMVVLNFVLFLLVALGQVSIFMSVRSNTMMSDTTKKSKDSVIARRLFTVVLSNFLCWFPIGLLGILSSLGISIPGEVNVGIVIFILPLNSVLNPFLYTLNILQERRRKIYEARLMEYLRSKATSSITMGDNHVEDVSMTGLHAH